VWRADLQVFLHLQVFCRWSREWRFRAQAQEAGRIQERLLAALHFPGIDPVLAAELAADHHFSQSAGLPAQRPRPAFVECQQADEGEPQALRQGNRLSLVGNHNQRRSAARITVQVNDMGGRQNQVVPEGCGQALAVTTGCIPRPVHRHVLVRIDIWLLRSQIKMRSAGAQGQRVGEGQRQNAPRSELGGDFSHKLLDCGTAADFIAMLSGHYQQHRPGTMAA